MLSKWTAIKPVRKQKHFLIVSVIQPENPEGIAEWVEIEAVYSRATTRMRWRELLDETIWQRGWK
jgi:tryptophan-rich hypothetical protein